MIWIALGVYLVFGGLLVGLGKGLRRDQPGQTGSDIVACFLWPLFVAIAVGICIGEQMGKKK